MHTYRIRLEPASKEVAVELEVELAGRAPDRPVDLSVPTWVPGAYGFMRYGRDVFDVHARDADSGAELSIERHGFSGFRVAPGARRLSVSFRAKLCDPAWAELAGYVEGSWAVLLATRYLFVPELSEQPVQARYDVPEGYTIHHPDGAVERGERTWEYPSFRALLDTPVVAWREGVTHLTRPLEGTPFHYLFLGHALGLDSELDGFVAQLEAVALECKAIFGAFPFAGYTFVFAFDPRFHWGLEHADATMIGLGQDVFIDDEARFDALRVSVHELVHAWNVCRLRPRGFGTEPGELDLVGGSFTDGLWVSEGFTRYYEFLLCVRAGQMTPQRFFSNVARYHRALGERPAHARTSVADSSLATFLNHHRYPGAVASMVDYYDHGMLVAFELDAALRRADASPPCSLDAEFRAFYEAFAGRARGFTTDEAIAFFGDRAPSGAGARALLLREVKGTEGLSTLEQLAALGFELETADEPVLGLILKDDRGPDVVDVLEKRRGGRGDRARRVIVAFSSVAFTPRGWPGRRSVTPS